MTYRKAGSSVGVKSFCDVARENFNLLVVSKEGVLYADLENRVGQLLTTTVGESLP